MQRYTGNLVVMYANSAISHSFILLNLTKYLPDVFYAYLNQVTYPQVDLQEWKMMTAGNQFLSGFDLK